MNENLRHHSNRNAALRLACFCLLIWLFIDLPEHPEAIKATSFLRIPVEVPALVALLALVIGPLRKMLIGFLLLLAAGVLFLKLADLGTQAAFQRPFNPYLDAKMVADGWNVLSGSLGTASAALVVIAALAGFVTFLLALRWAAHFASHQSRSFARRTALAAVSCFAVLLAMLPIQQTFSWQGAIRADATTVPTMLNRVALIARSVEDMRSFEAQLAAPDATAARSAPFGKIAGRDVFLIFVESYGRSAVEDPRYAPIIQPRLQAAELEMAKAGYQGVSRWITSPTVGGLSWLAHGTLLSGLWVDSQARYDRLVRSQRQSLNALFRQAGWTTVAAMPAITMDWPEARYFGYDAIFAAKDLGYRGKPFNWITMPDQFTLSAIDRLVRNKPTARPAMIETALISSHAPWTPIASLIPWEDVGDGSVFSDQATSGKTPAQVWADADDVRRHYIQTIDYSLQTISSYVANYGRGAVFIVIGDHQPAAIITGPNASRAVPLHILSSDTALLEHLQQHGFAKGLMPSDKDEIPMNALRDLFVELF